MQGAVHGYTDAIWFAVGMLVPASAIVVTLVNAGSPGSSTVWGSAEAVPVVAH